MLEERINNKFIELLKERYPEVVAHEEYAPLCEEHKEGSLAMLEALIDKDLMSRKNACILWSESIGITYVDPTSSIIQPEVVEKIPEEVARKIQVVGLYEIHDILTISSSTPEDTALLKRIEAIAQTKLSPVFSLPSEIKDAIDVNYSSEESLSESIHRFEEANKEVASKLSDQEIVAMGESTQVTEIFESLIFLAIKERASDIHMEPFEEYSRVRFRVDGQLREFLRFSKALHPAMVARGKIVTDQNIAETRIPQDGSFSMKIGSSKVNFRVNFMPSRDGEKVVIRILAPSNKKDFLTLDQMLISQSITTPFKRLIENPNGIIFVTGPTGSGKTTTLYAALHEINKPTVNVSTIEDPIEMQLDGITQSQVNHAIGLKFSTLLRALLRQDPDVLLVGEIRDLETAKIATEAALTGHLVFATLHTNTAVQAVLRLVEMGIEPYMVAPSILGVMAQRLAARICDRCKEAYYPSLGFLEKYFDDVQVKEGEIPFYKGNGCSTCRNTGYRGRVAFHELVIVTEEIRDLISENASSHKIEEAAQIVGYKPLRYDGLKKALLGLTTLEQIDQIAAFSFTS